MTSTDRPLLLDLFCGAGGCSTVDYTIFSEDYSSLKGYNADADLGLGCGLPTEFALIKEGDTVVDLGSGAGNDAFVARAIAGPTGKVLGLAARENLGMAGAGLEFTLPYRRAVAAVVPMLTSTSSASSMR